MVLVKVLVDERPLARILGIPITAHRPRFRQISQYRMALRQCEHDLSALNVDFLDDWYLADRVNFFELRLSVFATLYIDYFEFIGDIVVLAE